MHMSMDPEPNRVSEVPSDSRSRRLLLGVLALAVATVIWLPLVHLLFQLLSPADLLLKAAFIVVAFGICELAGLREHTTIISGTTASPGISPALSAVWAALYMVVYFALVVLVPILVFAAGLLFLANRWFYRRAPWQSFAE